MTRRSQKKALFRYNEYTKYFIWFAGLLLSVLLLFVPIRTMAAWQRISQWPGKVWKQVWHDANTVDDLEANWDVIRRDLRKQGVDLPWSRAERAIKSQSGDTITDDAVLYSLRNTETGRAMVLLVVLRLLVPGLFFLFIFLRPNQDLFILSPGSKVAVGTLGVFLPPAALVVLFIRFCRDGCLDEWCDRTVFLSGVLLALLLFGIFVS